MERLNGGEQVLEGARRISEAIACVEREIQKIIVGQEDVIRLLLLALVAGGHVLLEGVPGLGKTLIVRTLSQVLSLKFSRIQFTPDLMPADITGTRVLAQDPDGRRRFEFQPGPLFAQIILADEINRATPKTQSALLEAMQERCVTVAGTSFPLDQPFFVLATQNPIEMEGTYPLPEAQVDRFFFKLKVGFPSEDDLAKIVDRTTINELPQAAPVLGGKDIIEMGAAAREVPLASHVRDCIVRLVLSTHPSNKHATPAVKKYVRYGASPRAAQAITLAARVMALLAGRFNVSLNDVAKVAHAALRHRVILNFQGEAEGVDTEHVVSEALEHMLASTARP
ncbi:MAG: AAA family ATPase [Bacillota bacterium]